MVGRQARIALASCAASSSATRSRPGKPASAVVRSCGVMTELSPLSGISRASRRLAAARYLRSAFCSRCCRMPRSHASSSCRVARLEALEVPLRLDARLLHQVGRRNLGPQVGLDLARGDQEQVSCGLPRGRRRARGKNRPEPRRASAKRARCGTARTGVPHGPSSEMSAARSARRRRLCSMPPGLEMSLQYGRAASGRQAFRSGGRIFRVPRPVGGKKGNTATPPTLAGYWTLRFAAMASGSSGDQLPNVSQFSANGRRKKREQRMGC